LYGVKNGKDEEQKKFDKIRKQQSYVNNNIKMDSTKGTKGALQNEKIPKEIDWIAVFCAVGAHIALVLGLYYHPLCSQTFYLSCIFYIISGISMSAGTILYYLT
jgi:hypothetical protein